MIKKGLFLFSLAVMLFLHPHPGCPENASLPSPEEMLKNMEAAIALVNDYVCIADAKYKSGWISEEKVYKVYFKRPGRVRIEVLEGDPGSAAVLLENGKVRGHKGGLLSWLKLTVDIDSPLATTIRGHRMDQGHFIYMVGAMRDVLKTEEARVLREEKADGRDVYVMEVVHGVPRGGLTREMIYVDKNTWMLKKILGFEGEKEVINVVYNNLILNPGLEDALFTL